MTMVTKDSQETTPKPLPKTSRGLVDIYAAQCAKCLKWRVIDSQEEYEKIRSKLVEEPFCCDKKPALSCEDPADIEYDTTRTWVIDKPNIPKTPAGFKRSMVLRRDFSKMDAYYITPTGKRLKSRSEVASFLEGNPQYQDLSVSDFNFQVPKVIEDTIPDYVVRKTPASASSPASGKRPKMSPDDVEL